MKASFWLCLLIGLMVSTPAFAQEEDDIDRYFSTVDADGDDKISAEEMKSQAEGEVGPDATKRDKLIAWGPFIRDFVLADTDDDRSVTRKEFRDYVNAIQGEEKIKFSKEDWAYYQENYLDVYIADSMTAADKDGDKALSKDEFNTLSDADPEEFVELDVDGNGKVTGDEYKTVVKKYLAEYYEFEEGEGEATDAPEVDEETLARFKEFDTDGDGNLSVAEWKSHMTGPDSAKADWWGLYLVHLVVDSNDDSNIDLAEFAKFAADQPKGIKPKLMPSDRKAFLDTVWKETDGDSDGKISRAEYVAIAPDGAAAIYGEEFDGMDADKSGDVTRNELWSSFKQHLGDYELVEEEEGDTTDEQPEKPEGGEGKIDREAYALYLKKGRTWLIKSVSDVPGMGETVTFTKWEVLEVGDTSATCKMSTLDKDQNETYSTEIVIEFKAAGDLPEGAPEVEVKEETLTVEAGEFECYVTTTSDNTTWASKKYPGLLVKSVTKGDYPITTELVDFTD